jgi:hypothetical protein
MQWIVIAVILIVAYYFVILKPGRLDFWKVASNHPDDVYEMFQQQDCWLVFVEKPEGGYKNELPDGEWDGPFNLAIPKLGGRLITVYGRVPDYEAAQQQFMDKMNRQRP